MIRRKKKEKDIYNLKYYSNFNKSINFCIICMILFFGISSYMLIFDYFSLPKKNEEPDWYVGKSYWENKFIKKDFDATLSIGDHKISNLENIIIWVLMLWGFMRTIDLLKLFEEEKVFYRIRDFFVLCENL